MAEIKLNLREPNAQKETPINVVIRYNGDKLVYSSGKRILPTHWDINFQRAKKSKEYPHAELLNSNLRSITHGIEVEIETFLKQNDQQYPDNKQLKSILDLKFGRITKSEKKTFFEFINWFT